MAVNSARADRTTRRLLTAGLASGPVFLGSWAVQALTRDGFEPSRHPLSLLSLGEHGWVQVATFVVTGGLAAAGGWGIRRCLPTGPGRTWGPLLVGGYGLGLVLAGIFVTDPGAGFPAGAPAGAPESMSWHGILHEVGFITAMLSWTAAAAVFGLRSLRLRDLPWAVTLLASALAAPALPLWPADPATFVPRTMLATTWQFALLAALTTRLLRGLPSRSLVATQPAPAVRQAQGA